MMLRLEIDWEEKRMGIGKRTYRNQRDAWNVLQECSDWGGAHRLIVNDQVWLKLLHFVDELWQPVQKLLVAPKEGVRNQLVCFILLVVGWDVLEDACSTQRFAPLSVHVRFEAELQEV